MKYIRETIAGLAFLVGGCSGEIPNPFSEISLEKEVVELYRHKQMPEKDYLEAKTGIQFSPFNEEQKKDMLAILEKAKDKPQLVTLTIYPKTGVHVYSIDNGVNKSVYIDNPDDGHILSGTDDFPDEVTIDGKPGRIPEEQKSNVKAMFAKISRNHLRQLNDKIERWRNR